MRLLQGRRWRSGGPVSWLWRATRAATTSSTFKEEVRRILRLSSDETGSLLADSSRFISSCSPLKTTLFLVCLYPGSELSRKYGRLCVQILSLRSLFDMQGGFCTSVLGITFPLWFPLIQNAEVFYAGTHGVMAAWDTKGHVAFMKQTKKLLL